MRLRNVKDKKLIMEQSNYLINDYSSYRGKWNSYFKNDNPIYVEIGMGKGKFLIENAILHPDINYIGIERYDSVIARALQKVPEGLNNLALIRANANDIENIFDYEIDLIYLNFSDPWPKNRHHLRRLSSSVFLDKYEKIFKGNKTIEMRTDNSSLFAYSLVSFSEAGYVIHKISFDLHKDDYPLVTTEYEDRFSRDNIPIYYVSCTKDFVKKRK